MKLIYKINNKLTIAIFYNFDKLIIFCYNKIMNELEYLKNSENEIIKVDSLNKKMIVLFVIYFRMQEMKISFWILSTA